MNPQPLRLVGRAGGRERASGSLRGGTSGPLPAWATIIGDDLRRVLGVELRVATPESSPMLELRSLDDDRSAYFHPPTGTLLVYDEPQEDAALVEAHDILQRHPTPVSRVVDGQPIGSIEYYATGACNLRCGYCYLGPLAEEPQPPDLNPIGFVRRIEALLREGRIAPKLRVAVIGGEPLLAFRGLRQIIDSVQALARQYGIDVSFGITTNAYRLDDETAAFLRDRGVAMKVSYDGRFDAKNRPAKRVQDGPDGVPLSRIRRLTDGMRVTINATLLPPQFESQAAVFSELADEGFTRVQVSVANGFSWTDSDLRRFFHGLCALTWESARRGCLEVQQAQVIDILRDYKLRHSHCGAGVSHLAIDAEGNVESCSTSFNHDGHGRHSTYGLFDVDRDPACRACAFRYGCGGGCRAFRRGGHPDITDCAPIYLRFLLAMGIVAEFPDFVRTHSSPRRHEGTKKTSRSASLVCP